MNKLYTIILSFLFLFSSNIFAEDETKLIDKICKTYDTNCMFWGYDMSSCSTLQPWEYWEKSKNWKKGTFIDRYTEKGNVISNPYIVKVDENTIEIHNLLQNYGVYFDDDIDYKLVGTVDEENKTILIPCQEVKEGLFFGHSAKYDENGIKQEDIESLTITISETPTKLMLYSDTYSSVSNSFAFYFQNEAGTGMYATLGKCSFEITIEEFKIFYDFNPNNSSPDCQEPQSSLSEIVIGFEHVPSINPAFENSIKVTKDNQPYDAEYLIRHTGEYLSTVTFEFLEPITEAGVYSITFPKELIWYGHSPDFSSGYTNSEFTLTYTIGDGTGIAGVQTGGDADAVLYDLQGVKVDGKSAKAGVYIRKTGTKTEKVYIR